MAGTEHRRRRFVTRHDVEDAAAAGRSVRVQDRDVLTDEAAQRAMDLGVQVERASGGEATRSSAAAGSAPRTPQPPPVTSAELRRAVRAAVIAELGEEPAGLDSAIDRVLQRRSREV